MDNERGMPRTPDGTASGRQVKCAVGGGGDGARIGGEWVGCAFWKLRPEFIKSGLRSAAGYNMHNVGGRR